MTRKICVVTGSRADYGLLYHPIKAIDESSELELCLVVSGMHLSSEFGLTYRKIEEDGFRIAEKVEMLQEGDSSSSICKSIAAGVVEFTDVFQRQKPDYILFLGDRFELMAAAQVAMIMKIPMIHLCGGDVTEGAFDDTIRHCLTKMSHIHFPTNEESRKKIIQMGEDPNRVYCVGSPGVDKILTTKLWDKERLEKSLNFTFKERNLLITFHPTTLSEFETMSGLEELLSALDMLKGEWGIIFTKANADTDGRRINGRLAEYISSKEGCILHDSLGQERYYSVLSRVDAMVGNSSSGLYEAPVFRKPTVNIGERQKGRLSAGSVINCNIDAKEIRDAILKAIEIDCSQIVSPYGDGNSTKKIMEVLNKLGEPGALLQKSFRSIEF